MIPEVSTPFAGFPDFRSNVTFVPIQFFTVVLPHSSRGTSCVVGYVLRRLLGYVDTQGNPTREQLQFSYAELVAATGVSRGAIKAAVAEAVERRFLRRVPTPPAKGRPCAIERVIYALNWDPSDQLTHDPAKFAGFCYPEATFSDEPEGQQIIRRPKVARKNIPNAFFDYLLPRERKAVIRVVGALLFKSIQWGAGGERRVPVTCSISELSRLTRLSRRHTHAAVQAACARGYLEAVDSGCFDPAAGQASRSATYGIRWARNATSASVSQPRTATEGIEGQYKKVNGEPVQKGERAQDKKVNGKEYKKVNGINIKRELKIKLKTTAVPAGPATATAPTAAAAGFELLVKTGFDAPTARWLASRHSSEVIERQIEWLPLRGAARNRLGLLRRAIEQDWPKPEGAPESAGGKLGRLFASHYYAAYHGYTGEAATEPFPKDLELAARFVVRLLALLGNEALIPEWGRRFGRLMRDKHQSDSRAKPNLSTALVLYGDRFLRVLQSEIATRRTAALGKAKEAHERAFLPAYTGYLRHAEIALQEGNAGPYEGFLAARRKLRQLMSSGPFLASAERLLAFDSDASRLLALADYFHRHPQQPVLSFWEWDRQSNPQRFREEAHIAAASQETHA